MVPDLKIKVGMKDYPLSFAPDQTLDLAIHGYTREQLVRSEQFKFLTDGANPILREVTEAELNHVDPKKRVEVTRPAAHVEADKLQVQIDADAKKAAEAEVATLSKTVGQATSLPPSSEAPQNLAPDASVPQATPPTEQPPVETPPAAPEVPAQESGTQEAAGGRRRARSPAQE